MLIVFLVSILAIAFWIVSNDSDQVHNLAATATAIIAIFWLLLLATLPIKLLVGVLVLGFSQHFYLLHK